MSGPIKPVVFLKKTAFVKEVTVPVATTHAAVNVHKPLMKPGVRAVLWDPNLRLQAFLHTPLPESLPVVSNPSSKIFNDRNDPNLKWYVPDLEISSPLEIKKLFVCEELGEAPDESGKMTPYYSSTLILNIEFKEPANLFQEVLKTNSRAVFKMIPVTFRNLFLKQPVIGGGGFLQIKEIKFDLTNQALYSNNTLNLPLNNSQSKITSTNLSNKDLTLDFEISFEGWKPVSTEQKAFFRANPGLFSRSASKMANTEKFIRFKRKTDGNTRTEYLKQLFFIHPPAISLTYPCADYGDYYVKKTEAGEISFRCIPPWDEHYNTSELFRLLPLGPQELTPFGLKNLPLTIYENLSEVNTFLMIPDGMAISRAGDKYAPDVCFISVINPDSGHENETKVVFNISMMPDISLFQLKALEQLLYAHCVKVNGKPLPPTILEPERSDIEITYPDKIEISAPVSSYSFAPDSDGKFKASMMMENMTIPNATLITKQLNTENSFLSLGKIKYKVNDVTIEKGVNLTLSKTSGNVAEVVYIKEEKKIIITNHCESPLSVKGFLFFNENIQGYQYVSNVNPVIIDSFGNKETVIATIDNTFSNVMIHYEIDEVVALIKEKRINLDVIQSNITIESELDPVKMNISHIDTEVIINGTQQKYLINLTPVKSDAGKEFFKAEVLQIILPLDLYIKPSDRNLKYKSTIHLKDNKTINTAERDLNFGTDPFIKITVNE